MMIALTLLVPMARVVGIVGLADRHPHPAKRFAQRRRVNPRAVELDTHEARYDLGLRHARQPTQRLGNGTSTTLVADARHRPEHVLELFC